MQLALILAVCRLVGWIGRSLGQPQVVGEMVAGVLLGPSLLGRIAPELQGWLFPRDSMPVLYTVAQVGLSLYMFTVGMELDIGLIRSRIRSAASISIAGIAAPFALGCAVAAWLHGDPRFFGAGLASWEGMAFVGAAMSITAFPMLARIIDEQGLTGTPLGTLALAAGALDDAAAWGILALVLASVGGHAAIAVTAIGGGLLYAAAVLFPGRRLLAWLGSRWAGGKDPGALPIVLILLALGSWFTDAIGIYAVFGAFVLGAAMPRGAIGREVRRKIEPLATSLLLPLFFVYSGLNTRVGLINSIDLLGIAAIILLVACAGKGIACSTAALLHGEGVRESLALGALLNARGLMELIILNIGLERGVITPTLFTIMVLMAIATTLMATPLFRLARSAPPRAAAAGSPDSI